MPKGLFGHVIIKGKITANTGLHIGASADTVEIGGIDSPVIKHPISLEPYIPGSSLKGKMRSLLEKIKIGDKQIVNGKEIFYNRTQKGISIHVHDDIIDAKECEICRLFGSTAGKGNRADKSSNQNHPARILVRDAILSNKDFLKADTLLITEAKTENVLDRINSSANPRTIERVPSDAEFNFEIVYRVEGEGSATGIQISDKTKVQTDIKNILLLLRSVEREGLGGSTSRGYGQVSFELIDFFYQKVKESGLTSQFPESKVLSKVIGHVNKDTWELQGL